MPRPLLFVAIVLAGMLLVPVGIAHHTPTHGVVENGKPQVAHIDAPHVVTPIAGGHQALVVDVEVFEPNGWQDIQRVNITVYAPDGTSVHRMKDATPVGLGAGTTRTYRAEFTMAYHDAPANASQGYVIRAQAHDRPGQSSDPAYHMFAYEALTAIGFDDTQIHFGETQPGQASPPFTLSVRNLGNLPLAIQVSGTALRSPEGHTIPASAVRLDASGDADFTNSASLSESPQDVPGFEVAPGPGANAPTAWRLHVPLGDSQYVPAGAYAGSILIEAVAPA